MKNFHNEFSFTLVDVDDFTTTKLLPVDAHVQEFNELTGVAVVGDVGE